MQSQTEACRVLLSGPFSAYADRDPDSAETWT